MIDSALALPLYHQVAGILRQRIEEGVYPAGMRLNSEDELAVEFDVSRATVRQAMSELATEGLVVRRRRRDGPLAVWPRRTTRVTLDVALAHRRTSPREEILMTSAVTANHEANGVVAWRHTQLVRSGFPEEAAAGVAEDDRYDLHRLIELVERGCPPELALRILAPLEEDRLADHGELLRSE